ncbi:hypothetical protein ACQCX2_04795 [Propionibacteriaceae bacterium Y1700]|uniref:hypothetical protein n=1 Tax=Microlunatus sp. Y1700 TaxID=3418487 RepID=UPI003DA72AC3
MTRMIKITLVVCLLALTIPLPHASAAGPVTTTKLSSAKSINPGNRVTVLQKAMYLQSGEKRHVRARIDTTSSTDKVVALTLSITCTNASGTVIGKSRATARNHEGFDGPYKITGRLPIYADALLTAPAAGTYTCALEAWTASSVISDYHLTAVANDTWLQTSDTDQVGAYQWTNPACDSQGTLASCTYLGAGTDTSFLFYDDGTPRHVWTASSSATSVDVAASYTLTTCYTNTSSCKNESIKPYQKPSGSVVTVMDATLQLIQLDATNHTCHTTTNKIRATISDPAHHYAISQTLGSIPIRSDCGSRDFLVRVQLDHISGQPVKVDGQQSSAALATAIIKNR